MSPHRIRLTGPWEWRPASGDTEAEGTGSFQRCRLPFVSDDCGGAKAAMLLRRFHCPTGINDLTLIFIVLEFSDTGRSIRSELLQEAVVVRLNGRLVPLGDRAGQAELPDASRSDAVQLVVNVSKRLRSFNELQVVILTDGFAPFALDAAFLEIQDPL